MRHSSALICRAALSSALLLVGCGVAVAPSHDAGRADADATIDASEDRAVVADAGCRQDRDCPSGLPRCDATSGRCVACTDDAQCASGMRCLDFVCQTRCGAGPACTGSGTACCNDACVQTQTDPRHCGACGVTCPTGEWCTLGRCVTENACTRCTSAQTCCNNACVDVRSDAANCGACGRVCLSGQGCFNGSCNGCGPCPAGHSCCNGACVNLASDGSHCGMCGLACVAGTNCVMGRCQ